MASISTILDSKHLSYSTPYGTTETLPFVNRKCYAHVRVVDYYPPDLEDFAQSRDNADFNSVPENEHEDLSISYEEQTPPNRWEWAFFLLVEDAKPISCLQNPPRMKLLVSGQEAQFLLKLDAAE